MKQQCEDSTMGDLQPRERCPTCSGAVDQVSDDPLEEHGIEVGCGYYRAEGIDGEVILNDC
jgi:uncharacterized protein with PIN domain